MLILPPQQKRSDGVTLFLSILVLAAITAVAFSLASVTLVEIQTSGDVERTEPSYYADQGITEEAIYSLKRKVSSVQGAPNLGTNCATTFVSYTGPDPSIAGETKICDIMASYNIEVRILTSANTYATARRFYLYNPANFGLGAGGYGNVSVTNTSKTNTTIHVYICKLINDCSTTGIWEASSNVDITPGNGRVFILNGTASDGSYELAITNKSVATPPDDAFAQIISYDTNNVGKGLPYLNKKAIQIQSTKSGLTRKVEVLIPTQ